MSVSSLFYGEAEAIAKRAVAADGMLVEVQQVMNHNRRPVVLKLTWQVFGEKRYEFVDADGRIVPEATVRTLTKPPTKERTNAA